MSESDHRYRSTLASLAIFGIAMGYLEAVVVVYLRTLFYPDGFSFPLVPIPARLIGIEIGREAATVVMLGCVAWVSGRRFWERFGWFIYMFGIWDIWYYVWLKVTLGWPATLVDWDILFLIPLPWIGPVIAPALIAVVMIVAGALIGDVYRRGRVLRPSMPTWALVLAGTVVLLYSFMRDLGAGLRGSMPVPYAYWMLGAGLGCYVAGLYRAMKSDVVKDS
jgi:hypothetical protein